MFKEKARADMTAREDVTAMLEDNAEGLNILEESTYIFHE